MESKKGGLYILLKRGKDLTSKKPSIPTCGVRSLPFSRSNIISFFFCFLPKSMWLYNHTHIYKVEICNAYQWMVITTKKVRYVPISNGWQCHC